VSGKVSPLFGSYVLPGRIDDPKRGLKETLDAERIGLGTVWLSERWALKESSVFCGAMSQITSKIRIAGTFYIQDRSPQAFASVCSTMQSLSGNRFVVLLARGSATSARNAGQPVATMPLMADTVDILRRLWAGERVSYQGPAGHFPMIYLNDPYPGPPPPLVVTAIGPKTLAFAGKHFDGALLMPMLTTDAVARSAALVREGARKAGRDPKACKVYATIIVAPDLPPDEEEAVVGGRAVTYFQSPGVGHVLVEINGWDLSVLDQLQAHHTLAHLRRTGETADHAFTRQQLVESSRVLPRHWLTDGAAIGSAAECARRCVEYLQAGADEIVLHGSAPAQMQSMVRQLELLL